MKRNYFYVGSLFFGMVLAILAYMAWLAGRGFNITDEANILIKIQYGNDFPSLTAFGIYWRPLGYLLDGNIYWLRMIDVFLVTLVAIFFTLGLMSALKRCGWEGLGSLSFLMYPANILFALAMFQLHRLSPGYNQTLVIAFGTGLGFYLLGRHYRGALFGCGMALGVIFFVKPPGAVAMCLVLLGSELLIGLSMRTLLVRAGLVLAGGLAWVVIHHLFFQALDEYFWNVEKSLDFMHALSTGRESLWFRYGSELLNFPAIFLQRMYVWLLCAAGLLIAQLVSKRRFPGLFAYATFLSLDILVIMQESYLGGYWIFLKQYMWIHLLLAHVIALYIVGRWYQYPENQSVQHERSKLPAWIVLPAALTPICFSFGTGNPLLINATLIIFPVVSLVLLMFFQVARRYNLERLFLAQAAFLVLLVSSQIIVGPLHAPYAMEPAQAQNIKYCFNGDKNCLLLDKDLHSLFLGTSAALKESGFGNKDHLLVLGYPGLNYALSLKPIGCTWYPVFPPGSAKAETLCLQRRKAGTDRDTWLVLPEGLKPTPEWDKVGFNFPGGYRLISTIGSPYFDRKIHFQIWAPRKL